MCVRKKQKHAVRVSWRQDLSREGEFFLCEAGSPGWLESSTDPPDCTLFGIAKIGRVIGTLYADSGGDCSDLTKLALMLPEGADESDSAVGWLPFRKRPMNYVGRVTRLDSFSGKNKLKIE